MMKQLLVSKGSVIVEDVPAPRLREGCLLVRVRFSCVSIGTELHGLVSTGESLWRKAARQPEKAKAAIKMLAKQGLSRTLSFVNSQLSGSFPSGYSVAGEVIAVGEGVDDVRVGERVACAGSQYSHHAEIVCVPRNLVCPVPKAVSLRDASTVAMGAIALQGVRRAEPTLGETWCVIGLGFLGQLTSQLLDANGCRCIGIDIDENRIELARIHGADQSFHASDENAVERVARLTAGHGIDGVIITAASPSSTIIKTAFQMCRKRGRVVLVGNVGLDIDREDMYAKELELRISSSYGPGRYESEYEERGLDYPIGYVRWTENRNMAAYLDMLDLGLIKLDQLIENVVPLDKAPQLYAALKGGDERPVAALISYGDEEVKLAPLMLSKSTVESDRVRLAIIGAGQFVTNVHVPNLRAHNDLFSVHAVVDQRGHVASRLAKNLNASIAASDPKDVIEDSNVDAVLIGTRHDSHADLVVAALEAGKHVYVEKPLALNEEQLAKIERYYKTNDGCEVPCLVTGFNRRFSPFIEHIAAFISRRTDPLIVSYRMNAGFIPKNHWVQQPEGGGRNIGEACHIYDLFTFLTQSRVESIQAASIKPINSKYCNNDNFAAILSFDDGSICTLAYTALGSTDYPKERLELYVDGTTIVVNDYKELQIIGAKKGKKKVRIPDKGHSAALRRFGETLLKGGDWPIALWEQLQAMRIAFEVERQLLKTTLL